MTTSEFLKYALVIILVSLLLGILWRIVSNQELLNNKQEAIMKKQDAILYLLETASIKQLPDEK